MDMAEVNPVLGSPADQEKTLTAASEIIGGWYGLRSRMQIDPSFVMPRP